jgi:hypothetical protein
VGLMNDARWGHTATLLPSGQVLVAGGCQDGFIECFTFASAELYDPANQTWTPIPAPMNDARWGHTATLLPSGQVLVAGGNDGSGGVLASAEL